MKKSPLTVALALAALAAACWYAGYLTPRPAPRPDPAALDEQIAALHQEKMARLIPLERRRKAAESAGDAATLERVLTERAAIDREYALRASSLRRELADRAGQ